MTDQDPTQHFTPPPDEPAVTAATPRPSEPRRTRPRPTPRRPRPPRRPRRARCRRSLRPPIRPSRPRRSRPLGERSSAAARSSGSWRSSSWPWSPEPRPRRPCCSPAASGTPSVLAWTPADSVAYTELRLDLPGDQQAELAEVMQRLPGLRRPGRVPDQDQRGRWTSSSAQRDRRRAVLDGRHRAVVRRPAGVSVGALPDRRPTPNRPAASPSRASRTPRRPARGPPACSRRGRRHDDHRDLQRRHDHRSSSRRRTSPHGRQGADRLRRHRSGARPRRRRLRQGRDRHRRQERPQHRTPSSRRRSATLTGDRLAFAYIDTEAIVDAAAAMAPSVEGMPAASLPAFLDDLLPALDWPPRSRRTTAPSCSRRASRTSRSSARRRTPSRPCPRSSRPTPSRSPRATTSARR